MSRPIAWSVVIVILWMSVTAQQQHLVTNGVEAPTSSGRGFTRRQHSFNSTNRLRFSFRSQGGALAIIGTEHLTRIKASSGLEGSLAALAAQLDADDDLVRAVLMWHVCLVAEGVFRNESILPAHTNAPCTA
jgi:hypothetical protein